MARFERASQIWKSGTVAGLLSLALFVAGAEGARAETMALSRDEVRAMASDLVAKGRAAQALPLAEALVKSDPTDFGAQLLASYAARDLGQTDKAEAYARAAWDLAKTEQQRHSASLAMAQAKSSGGARSSAQFWLRRAVEHAPDDRAKLAAIRDYRYVRARNPLSFSLDFGVSPSSNINNGASTDTIWMFGLPFELEGKAQALSGVQYRARAAVEWTVAEARNHRTRLGFSLGGHTYTLSDEAKATAPDAKGSDYALWAAEVSVDHRRRAKDGGEWQTRFTLGHNDYGGDPMSNYVRLDAGRSFEFSKGQSLRFGATLERQKRLDYDGYSATIKTVSTNYRQPLGPGALGVGVQLGQIDAASVEAAHDRARLSLDYWLDKPVAGMDLRLSASAEQRSYDPSLLIPDGRSDTKLSVGVNAVLPQMDYMGFAPELGLTYTRNRSNSVLYDTRELGVNVGMRSLF